MPERRRWALASIAAIDDGVGAIVESLRDYGIEDDQTSAIMGKTPVFNRKFNSPH